MAIFHWKDKETFAPLFLAQLRRQGFANDLGLSEYQLLEFVRRVSDSLPEFVETGMDFHINFSADDPNFGQYEINVFRVQRERKGWDVTSIGKELGSFVVEVPPPPTPFRR